MRDASMSGIAMSFSELMKIVPKGFIQSVTNPFPASNCNMKVPKIAPSSIPIKIFQ
jgi:hypothetical protein